MAAICFWLVILLFVELNPTISSYSSSFLIQKSRKNIALTTWKPLFVQKRDFTDPTNSNDDMPPSSQCIKHPVLQNVYPDMIEYTARYGHPNIPLPEGKPLETLRRLHIQNKLSDDEVKFLVAMGFRFHSLEDVYDYADFDEMFSKLQDYAKVNGDVSPPKKYKYDPELGAWVTSIRRRTADKIQVEHRKRLDELDFQWKSPRECGSSFMKQYRAINERKQSGEGNVFSEEEARKWIKAMQKTTLSTTRQHYMEELVGKDWKAIEF
jgi:Helicase associated domain